MEEKDREEEISPVLVLLRLLPHAGSKIVFPKETLSSAAS
jgi:hypothetical protein